jgi:CTP synthase (UTP-ammonia lyase)
LVITPLACSLVGQTHTVRVAPGTLARRLYGVAEAPEDYYCNYGVNPEYVGRLEAGGLRVSGVDAEGEIRIVELPGHPFFVATLYLPQARSAPGAPHPLLAGWAVAVRSRGAAAGTAR